MEAGRLITGASPMPTIGAYAQALPQGFETQAYRCTDGTVHVCLEPGDLIMTGTPEGANAGVRGDALHGAIQGLGEITATVAS